jgi:hypothetical protein
VDREDKRHILIEIIEAILLFDEARDNRGLPIVDMDDVGFEIDELQ